MSCIAWVYRKFTRVYANILKTDLVSLLLWCCNAKVVVFEISKVLLALGINFSQLEQERESEREREERERRSEREREKRREKGKAKYIVSRLIRNLQMYF